MIHWTGVGRESNRVRRIGSKRLWRCYAVVFLTTFAGATPWASALVPGEAATRTGVVRGEVRKELVDPCVGARWQLVIDPGHPEWPARMVLVHEAGNIQRAAAVDAVSSAPINASSAAPRLEGGYRPAVPIVIRAGDRLTVDQQTLLVHARLQAVALGSAQVGQLLLVRLSTTAFTLSGSNGPVITVVATGAKQAQWPVAEGSGR